MTIRPFLEFERYCYATPQKKQKDFSAAADVKDTLHNDSFRSSRYRHHDLSWGSSSFLHASPLIATMQQTQKHHFYLFS